MLFRSNTGLLPLGGNFVKLAGGVVHIPVVFHVVSIRVAVAKDSAGDTSFFLNVVVAAHLANILRPAAHTHQFGVCGFQHLFGFGNVHC